MACNGYPTISRNNLNGKDLRERQPNYSHASVTQTLAFNETLYNRLTSFTSQLNYYINNFYEGGGQSIAWLGQIGTCAGPPGEAHVQARAFDLTYVKITGGTDNYINMDGDWRTSVSLARRRRYLAVAAVARGYVSTVLTGWYNSAHSNHMHLQDMYPDDPTPIRDSGSESDASFVQAACNYFNGANLSIDGVWGTQTENAFQSLRTALNMQGSSIKTSLADTNVFLGKLASRGMANNPA